jgi:hypothetical protein
MPDVDYQFHRLKLLHLFSAYALEYWRLRALLLYCASADPADEATVLMYLAQMLAIEHALIKACHVLKVDVGLIRQHVGCLDAAGGGKNCRLAPVNDELVRYYVNLFVLT